MRKYAAIILLALLSSSALADDDSNPAHQFFYRRIDNDWEVFGNTFPDHAKRHDTCSIVRAWDDGSQFQISKDLQDNTLYLWMHNMDWNNSDEPGTKEEFRINAFRGNKVVGGSGLTFFAVSKNVIYSADLVQENFLSALAVATALKFVAPGRLPNFNVPVSNGPKLISNLADCIKSSKDAAPAPDVKLPNLDSPLADKKKDAL